MKHLMNTQIILIFVLVIFSGIAIGQVPQLINYQGVLLDFATGQPVPDDTYTIIFSLYDVASGGSPIWTESQSVQTRDGLYDVLLGSITASTPAILSGPEKYLGTKVGNDPEMTPRKRIVSVAFAYISSSVSGDSNIFPSEGDVGIGTTIPIQKLDVAGNIRADNGDRTIVEVRANCSNTFDYAGITLTNGTHYPTTRLQVYGPNYLNPEAFHIYHHPNAPITISTNNLERMRIAGNGNVGIGTTNPTNKLHIVGAESVPLLNVVQTGSHRGIRVYTQNACALWVENAGNHGLRVTHANGDGIHVEQAGNWAGYFNGKGYFSSNFCIGTTSPTNILTIQQNSTTDPIADAWTIYSSKRWKTNIKPIDGALDKVNRLRGVSYDWKADGKHDIGLIAEEVGEVIPEVVAYEENGKDAKSIDYARLVAVLIEANKELQKEIEQQKLNNKKQQTAIDDLSARILNLEKTIRNSDTKLSNVINEIQ